MRPKSTNTTHFIVDDGFSIYYDNTKHVGGLVVGYIFRHSLGIYDLYFRHPFFGS